MKKNIFKIQILFILILCLTLSACSSVAYHISTTEAIISSNSDSIPSKTIHSASNPQNGILLSSKSITTQTKSLLKVSFIDVGQADSILIQNGSSSMLIDAGNNGDSDIVINYINQSGINKIDFLVATHPHEDHIGGMDAVINSFDIGKIYMPKVTTTTKTFKDVITAIANKKLTISTPIPDSTFKLGDATCTILAPNSLKYADLNNYSIVIKLVFGNTSFLFTGDAQTDSEQEMLIKGYNLKADLLKIGHHGSDTSTTSEFLKAVSPKFSIISVGKDNTYGHPKQVTLDKLANAGIQVFRTDLLGTIVASSDGQTIKFDKSASPIKPQAPPVKISEKATNSAQIIKGTKPNDYKNVIVYVATTGKKYHRDGCKYLAKSKIPMKLSDAKKGYTPCSVCNPPQ